MCMHVRVALPMIEGVWSMAVVLQQLLEYLLLKQFLHAAGDPNLDELWNVTLCVMKSTITADCVYTATNKPIPSSLAIQLGEI